MSHLRDAPFGAIGFCHETEIRLHERDGIRLAGRLPEEISRTTIYAAGVVIGGSDADGAKALIRSLNAAMKLVPPASQPN